MTCSFSGVPFGPIEVCSQSCSVVAASGSASAESNGTTGRTSTIS
jgi:hypothetical protein